MLNYSGPSSSYPAGRIFAKVGWVRGMKFYRGEWGAYLWSLQNHLAFKPSETETWRSPTNGASVKIINVIVGSLGIYPPVTPAVNIGPDLSPATNFPGELDWNETKMFSADTGNVFYIIAIPHIRIEPRKVVSCAGGSNIEYRVTGSNIPAGVAWSIIPSGVGAEIYPSNDWHYAGVTPGNVATNYKVRATAMHNVNFYDEVDLKVVKVDIVESNVYLGLTNLVSLRLTPESSANVQWEIIPQVQGGAFIKGASRGTSVVVNTGSLLTNYTVRAYAIGLTNCYDVCTVKVIPKVEIEKCSSIFLPQGGLDDNTTTIRAFVTPNTAKGKFKFTLFDVSDEKGYCLNAPTNLPASGEDSDSWKDFQFTNQTGFTNSGMDNNIAETVIDNTNEATVIIKSYDYGSFGKIKAEFTTEDNSFSCVAREVNGTNEFTRLPADTNDNDIADSWSGDTGPDATKEAINDRDNIPVGDGVDGDYLTRYDEYRGFIVQGAHVRTDPTQKDVFCRNYDIPAAGLSGFLTTENLGAPVQAIRADEWENDVTRRINPMSESHSYTLVSPDDLQTAIKVQDKTGWDGSILGETLYDWGKAEFSANLWVPNNLLYCVVDVAQIRTNGTELVEAATPSTNVLYVTSVNGYQTNGAIKIDDEIILYSGVTTNEYEAFIGCSRGAMDTTKASHNNGSAVMNFANANEVIQLVFGHEAGHVVNLRHTSGNNIMTNKLLSGSYLNNGYWSTYAPALALTNEFRVKP